MEAIGNMGAGVRSQKFNRRAKPFSKNHRISKALAYYPQQVYEVWQRTAPQTVLPSQRSHGARHRCKKKGHYKSQCFFNVAEVTEDSSVEFEDASFLDVVTDEKGSTSWNVSLSVNGQNMNFKVATGAEVSVISEETMNRLIQAA